MMAQWSFGGGVGIQVLAALGLVVTGGTLTSGGAGGDTAGGGVQVWTMTAGQDVEVLGFVLQRGSEAREDLGLLKQWIPIMFVYIIQ